MSEDQPRHTFEWGRDRKCWPNSLFVTLGLGIRWDLPCPKFEPTPAAFTFAVRLRLPGRWIVPVNAGKYLSLWPLGALRCRIALRPSLIRWRA